MRYDIISVETIPATDSANPIFRNRAPMGQKITFRATGFGRYADTRTHEILIDAGEDIDAAIRAASDLDRESFKSGD